MAQARGDVARRVQHVRSQHHVVVLLPDALRAGRRLDVVGFELDERVLELEFVFGLAHEARRQVAEDKINATGIARERREHTARRAPGPRADLEYLDALARLQELRHPSGQFARRMGVVTVHDRVVAVERGHPVGRACGEQHLGRVLITREHGGIVCDALVNEPGERRGPVRGGRAGRLERFGRNGFERLAQARILRRHRQRKASVRADELAQGSPAVVLDRGERSSDLAVRLAARQGLQQPHARQCYGQNLHGHEFHAVARQAGLECAQSLRHADRADAVRASSLTMQRGSHRADLAPEAPVDDVHRKPSLGAQALRNRILSHGSGGIVGLAGVAKKRISRREKCHEIQRLPGELPGQHGAARQFGRQHRTQASRIHVLHQSVAQHHGRMNDAMNGS